MQVSCKRTETSEKDVASGLCPDKIVEKPYVSGHRPDATIFRNFGFSEVSHISRESPYTNVKVNLQMEMK